MTVEEALEKIKGIQVVPIDPNVKYLLILDQRYISNETGGLLAEWLSANHLKTACLWASSADAVRLLPLP